MSDGCFFSPSAILTPLVSCFHLPAELETQFWVEAVMVLVLISKRGIFGRLFTRLGNFPSTPGLLINKVNKLTPGVLINKLLFCLLESWVDAEFYKMFSMACWDNSTIYKSEN